MPPHLPHFHQFTYLIRLHGPSVQLGLILWSLTMRSHQHSYRSSSSSRRSRSSSRRSRSSRRRRRRRRAVHGTAAELLQGWAGVQSAQRRQGHPTFPLGHQETRGQRDERRDRRDPGTGANTRAQGRPRRVGIRAFYAHVTSKSAVTFTHRSGLPWNTRSAKAAAGGMKFKRAHPTSVGPGGGMTESAAGRADREEEEEEEAVGGEEPPRITHTTASLAKELMCYMSEGWRSMWGSRLVSGGISGEPGCS